MKDAVCSPGGTTIKGVAQLEKDGFRGSVIDAVDAIVGCLGRLPHAGAHRAARKA